MYAVVRTYSGAGASGDLKFLDTRRQIRDAMINAFGYEMNFGAKDTSVSDEVAIDRARSSATPTERDWEDMASMFPENGLATFHEEADSSYIVDDLMGRRAGQYQRLSGGDRQPQRCFLREV